MASTSLNSENENLSNMVDGNGFTFVDFLPEVLDPGGFFSKIIYENFKILVEHANDFLRSHRKWKIVTCETIKLKLPDGQLDPSKMSGRNAGDIYLYLRGLRLWLRERNDGNEREQQIGYFNIIPEVLKEGGIFSSPKYETLDAVIERINSTLQSQPLPGRIISIECLAMKFKNANKFDADRTDWVEHGVDYEKETQTVERFLFVLRIFYEVMAGISGEIIGVKDFIPERIREGGICGKDEYEPFSCVVDKVSLWRAQQYHLRICNVQTLEIVRIKAGKANTQKMMFLKAETEEKFIRVLRVAYTKPFAHSCSISANPSTVKQLTCRTFLPLQLSKGTCVLDEYENLATTKERISAWVKATGAHVLSAEMKTYRIEPNDETNKGSEESFAHKSMLRNRWMYVIRLYIDGTYEEPPPEMLPPVPVIVEKSCCKVS